MYSNNVLSTEETESISPELQIIETRYKCIINEVSFILNLAFSRKGRWSGQVTKDYLKKRVPPELQEEKCRLVFDQLKGDSNKFDDVIAEYKGTS